MYNFYVFGNVTVWFINKKCYFQRKTRSGGKKAPVRKEEGEVINVEDDHVEKDEVFLVYEGTLFILSNNFKRIN